PRALLARDGRADGHRPRPSHRRQPPRAGDRRPRAARPDREGGGVDAQVSRPRLGRRSACPQGRRMTKKAQRMLATMDRATGLWHIPNVGRAKGRVIRRLIDRHRPTRALEIGSLLGYSAILIAGALPAGGRLTCLEANDYLAKFVKANVTEAGLGGRVRVVVGDALRAIPLLSGRFAFVFIDARTGGDLDY